MSNFAKNKSKWKWTAMIMQPSFFPRKTIDAAIAEVRQKKNLAALPKMRVDTLTEGRCAQILHLGPFSEEGPTIEKVHQFIESKGKRRVGKHHEIYLTDIRRADPAKWKTVIRQPMQWQPILGANMAFQRATAQNPVIWRTTENKILQVFWHWPGRGIAAPAPGHEDSWHACSSHRRIKRDRRGRLAADGASVILLGRDRERLDAVASTIRQRGGAVAESHATDL
jgi:GyrI-like small molecule binding domain